MRRIRQRVAAYRYRNDLRRLAYVFGTDKWGHHWYMEHYQRHFEPVRKKRLNILEIGVGGHHDPAAGGNSLRTWKRFFPKSRIYGIDLHDKHAVDEHRIRTFKGHQADAEFLAKVADEIGPLDIVIDDGSHVNNDVIATFEVLFPRLRPHGIYAVEDVSSSYIAEFGGDLERCGKPTTIMRYFKGLLDRIHTAGASAHPAASAPRIGAAHFYQDLVVIVKGDETRGLV